jgi:nucleoside-diphosphate-sugar epimerase
MKVLILGASGATGKHVVTEFMRRKINTRIVIRHNAKIPDEIRTSRLVEIIHGNIYEFTDQELQEIITGCKEIVFCLGHNITLKGIFGKPHRLVCVSLQNICRNIEKNIDGDRKIVLMSTVAYHNKEAGERRSFFEKLILSILYLLLPPHKDNMLAANYLLHDIGCNNSKIRWTAVRPDSLIDNTEMSQYEIAERIKRSPLFDPGKTSRINVGYFIVELLTDNELWKKWQYKMPVIYNIG